MRLAKSVLSRILFVSASIVVTLILLEIAVRLFVPVTDYPLTMFYPDVGTHFRPDQAGVRRFGVDGVVGGRYRINGEGWNSLHDYEAQNDAAVLRVAVIGDSFIEGMQLDVDKHADMVIEQGLSVNSACQNYDKIQVYSYGMSGSPLSQYLNVLRYVSAKFPADIYIVNVVFNDIDQSWRSHGRSDFLTFRLNSENELEEVPPKAWVSGWTRPIAVQSALFRYFRFNLQLVQVLQNANQASPDQDQDASEPKALSVPEANATPDLIARILGDMSQITSQQHADLLLTIDADRLPIYGEEPADKSFTYALVVMEKAQELGVAFVDLNEPFTTDYREFHQRFDFPTDYHWNARGDQIMGNAAVDWIVRNMCQASPH